MHQFSALKYTIIDEGHLLLSDKLLEMTDAIDNADQTDLAHPFYSHDPDAASICHS
jgi:hypothetical protein